VGDIGAWMDEPSATRRCRGLTCCHALTRKHVTVGVGGDGGDEIFAGYPMYFRPFAWRGHSCAYRALCGEAYRTNGQSLAGEDKEPFRLTTAQSDSFYGFAL